MIGKKYAFLLAACLFAVSLLTAQTPGLIIRDGAGNIPYSFTPGVSKVLDPNGDGFTSVTNSGFVGGDVGAAYSEIPYRPVPIIYGEPTSDLSRGPNGGFSELVKDPNGVGMYLYYDGTNFLFRLRVGSIMAGSKGYSIMLDTDGKFGPEGPNADPTYQEATTGTNGNPGFEYEIVYETNFRVAIYFVNNACGTAPTLVAAYNLSDPSNRERALTSVALTNDSDNPDYFYDFYVPQSDLSVPGFVVGPTTPLRAITTTVMSPQGAICGPKSDVYGDDTKFTSPQLQYIGVINSQPPFTLNDLQSGVGVKPPCTAAPTVNNPIATTATAISGTWTRAVYSTATTATITVYRNGTELLGTTTATTGGTWTLTPVTLAANDVITAYAQSAGESSCNPSNAVQVLACVPATTSACPTVTCFTDRGAEGTNVAGSTIRIYRVTSTGRVLVSSGVIAGTIWGWNGSGGTGNGTNLCGTGGKDVADGTYVVTQQEPGKCESVGCTFYCIGGITSTAAPAITQSVVYTGTQTLSGTATSGARIMLYVNNVAKDSLNATGGTFSFSLTSYFLNIGDVLSVTAQATGQCVSTATTRTVQCFISAPIINADANQRIAIGSAISGTSAEAAGTTVTIYNGATNAVIGATTVQAGGTWVLASPVAAIGTSYYATQTSAACGTSVASGTVSTVSATTTARCGTITSPVLENATAVGGTLSSGGISTTVTLFIDGAEIGTTTTSVAAWSIPVNNTVFNRIYAGGVLSISIAEGANLAANCTGNTVTVDCIPPATPMLNINTAVTRYPTAANGVFSVTVTNSAASVFYFIERDPANTSQPALADGFSIAGNGGSIVLSSAPVVTPGNYTLRVAAVKLGTTCASYTSFNLAVADTDADGVADYADLDDDNDGMTDTDEGGSNTWNLDQDADGVLDYRDADYCTLNARGVCTTLDKDGDGIINQFDLDSDNDGIADIREAGGTDANGDGRADAFADTDGDGLADFLDLDSDNDGIADNIEAQTSSGYAAPAGADADNDGIDDAYDNDVAPGRALAPVDTDGDGMPDYRDTDSDDDGRTDNVEGWDTNGNGIIDGTEKAGGAADTDNDGLLDGWDNNLVSYSPANGTTPASYPDISNPGADRDWRDSYIALSGSLWNDGNGDQVKGTGESFISGTNVAGTGSIAAGSNLFVNVVDDATGLVVAVVQPDSDGQFSLRGLRANRNYRAVVTTTASTVGAAAPAVQLPSGWAAMGEDRNGTPESTTPGTILFNTNTIPGDPGADLSQLNQGFGFNRIPATNNINALLSGQLLLYQRYSLTSFPFTGTDAEDGPGGIPLQNGSTFEVISEPNSQDAYLVYNGSFVSAGDVISNFDRDLLEIVFLRIQSAPGVPVTGASFQYRLVDAAGTAGNTANYSISLTNILPVTALQLRANQEGSGVKLVWETTDESNTQAFVVERSVANGGFAGIGTVAAAGNSQGVRSYSFTDRAASGRVVLYRIRLQDRDGRHTMSNVVAVNLAASSRGMQVFPNPARDRAYLLTGEPGTYQIQLMNASGSTVWSVVARSEGGTAPVMITRGSLPAGMYLLRIANTRSGDIQYAKVCFE